MLRIIFIRTLKNTTQIKHKILIVFDDMIPDMLSNNKVNLIVTELFIRGGKLNISLVFITRFYFAAPKTIRLNSMHCFIMKVPSKRELNKLHLIIHQILNLKSLRIFTKNVQKIHIVF